MDIPMTRPCKRGHVGGRYASGACIECMALRKGERGRRVPPARADQIVKAASKLGKITTDEIKLRRAQARLERRKVLLELEKTQAEKDHTYLERFKAKAINKRIRPLVEAGIRATPTGKLLFAAQHQGEQFEYDETVDPATGTLKRTVRIDPRNGQPVRVKPTAPVETPAPPKAPEPEPRTDDKRPPWLQRGEGPRDKAEWLAWQNRRTNPTGIAVGGWADPGGTVSQAIFEETAATRGVRVAGRWPRS